MAARLVFKMNRSCFAVMWKSRDVQSILHRHPNYCYMTKIYEKIMFINLCSKNYVHVLYFAENGISGGKILIHSRFEKPRAPIYIFLIVGMQAFLLYFSAFISE